MEINKYLEQYAATSATSLHLEPNRAPYVNGATGTSNLNPTPLQGGQINGMIFGLIPDDVKKQLPNSQNVNFPFKHAAGNFEFSIKKTPDGFSVTVTKQKASPVNSFEPEINHPATDFPSQAPQAAPSYVPIGAPIEFDFEEPAASPLPKLEEPTTFAASDVASTSSIQEQPEIVDSPTLGTFEPKPVPTQSVFTQSIVTEPVLTENFAEVTEAVAPEIVSQPTFNAPVVSTPAPSEDLLHKPIAACTNPLTKKRMDELFRKMAAMGASDLHMSVSVPPMVRKDGKMVVLVDSEPALTPDAMSELLSSIMPKKNIEEYNRRHDTDFAYEIPNLARFRANIFMDRKGMGGVFRIIPSEILTAEKLNLSKHILDLCSLSKGLVVVTGPTGSGKSTTLCAMVDYINRDREDHIITIEDPIEFVHDNKKCLVNQREVHNHTDSFKDALRAALREDPDILLVGEMRDLETISIAIETAETGHLVFGTLHTTTAASTVDRIIDQFPADRQQQIRVMLSESLRGVIAQTLLPKKGGGRVAALEILIVTPAISNLIREGKTFQIPSAMQTGKNLGMVLLNDALIDLCKQGIVEPRDAYIKAVDKTGFEMQLERNGLKL